MTLKLYVQYWIRLINMIRALFYNPSGDGQRILSNMFRDGQINSLFGRAYRSVVERNEAIIIQDMISLYNPRW